MAETATQSNNAAVRFRGSTEREMSVVSKAQNAAMHAAEAGKSTLGIPQKVGAEFVKGQKPGSVKKLPKRVRRQARHLAKSGMISPAAMKKHMGGGY